MFSPLPVPPTRLLLIDGAGSGALTENGKTPPNVTMSKLTYLLPAIASLILMVVPAHTASLTKGARVQVSTNNQNFNISVFPGSASYDDSGRNSPVPLTNTFGDGTVTDYNFIGNSGTGSALTTYASGGAGLIPTPTAPAANVHGNGENWSNVWTTTDPVGFTTAKNHNPTGVAGAANTFARCANVSGTIDISGLESGTVYIPHGTYVNNWTLTLTMTGPGQTPLAATDTQGGNGPSTNYGWITDFNFADASLYDTITYTYINADSDGSRARFMGVIIDGSLLASTPPTVTNSGASAISPTNATLGGAVTDAGGANPSVTLYWGDNDAGTRAGSWDHAIHLGNQGGAFSSGVSGLTPATTYYFRSFASNSAGEDWANSTATFSTGDPPDPPSIVNLAASGVSFIEADLNGSVTATGGETPNVTIYYGDNDGGTSVGSWDDAVSIGAQSGAFSTDLFGLTHDTTYFFRAFAQNSGGSAWAPSSASFTTAAFSLPAVINSAASDLTGAAAKVGGEVTSTGGDAPEVTIYWGDNDAGTAAGSWDHSVNLGAQSADFSSVLTGLSSLAPYYFRAHAQNAAGAIWAGSTASFTTLEVSELIINEFMAANDGGTSNNPNAWYPIANQISGTSDDWIEILNTGTLMLELGGWHLTDDAANLGKWTFPASTNLAAGGFLIVYASGNGTLDANGNLHTNFRLSAGGEYLALVRPGGSVASEFGPGGSSYPSQDDDVSYGLHPGTSAPVFFASPTSGSANDSNGIDQVRDTQFSPDRGYYQAAIEVTITSNTFGATIYYTTDGSKPVDSNGNPIGTASVYSTPVPISRTTVLRAAASKTGFAPTNIDCQTYILLDIDNANADGTDAAGFNTQFIQQTKPSGWGNLTSGDYNMDTTVSKSTATATNHGTSTAQTMLLGLRDIPTISIAMNRADFSGSNGIYTNSSNGSLEHECSAEFIPATGDPRSDWQINCGIKVQGGASRSPSASPKHAMNFRFRSEYGAGRLRQPLFLGSEVEEFNSITLRAGYNNSWIHRDSGQRGRGSMIRDQWMRESMLDMGDPAAGHGFMVHVFVNGLYWGVHNLCERPEASHYAAYNGDDDDLLDARNGSSIVDGNTTAWNAISGVVSGGDWSKIQRVIDINQYIDYQIINRYGGNADLKSGGNWRAAGGGPFPGGQPELMAPWQLYSWDGERTLESQNSSNSPIDPMGVRGTLEGNAEYRIRFADRLQKHFFNGGALTPEATKARWMKFADNLDRAIIAESARWGDHRGTRYTRDGQWLAEQNRLYNSYFPGRSATVLASYGSLFPSSGAPEFLVNGIPQRGGIIPIGGTLQLTGSSGTIYYTTDGSDPRLAGGGINPNTSSIGAGSNQTAFIDLEETGWRYLDNGVAQSDSNSVVGNGAYNTGDWKHPDFDDNTWGTGQALLGYDTINGRTTNTLLVRPTPRLPTIYFRKSFQVTDASTFTQIATSLVRDDGAILYLNGRELGRSNMNGGNQRYVDFALNATSNEGGLVSLGSKPLSPGDLVEGTNLLAVELHQSSGSSSDTGLDVQLRGIAPSAGGGSTVPLTASTLVRARAFDNGQWSPLIEAQFIVAPIADASNIVIAEFMYNPTGSSEDTEWIELMNISADLIDLTGLSFTGIDYTFPLGTTLAPGGRIVVVKNQIAFAAAYNTAGMDIAPGEFSTTSLDNTGEQLALIDAAGTDAQRFTYNDKSPWPTSPDGAGYSLVLIAPHSAPDHSIASNWRSSAALNGSPGTTDAVPFTGDPNLDLDDDGLPAFLEYAFGSIDGDFGQSPESHPAVGSSSFDNGAGATEDYLTLTYRRNLAADDALYEIQISPDLVAWSALGTILVSTSPNGDGTETVTHRSTVPVGSLAREFIRLLVTSRP